MQTDRLTEAPEYILRQIKPGMRIFLGTGVAEPRTFVKHLMASKAGNLQDLELIQLISFNEALSLKQLRGQKYRLKTFFAGWVVKEAIAAGEVDLIPSRFARLPLHFTSGRISIDMAVLQITPPDASGQCSLAKNNIKGNETSAAFTVSSLTQAGSTYNAGANHDPDGDSNGTTITVLAP